MAWLKRTNLLMVTLVAAAAMLAACLLALVGIEKAAEAAFPGVNGKIAFQSNRDGNNEIYTMDADGSNQTRLTSNTTTDGAGSWSPDGSQIAFTSFRDGNAEIYVMNADGSGQTNLTNNAAFDTQPTWSPDGRIAFLSDRDAATQERMDIWVMNADGSGTPQNLTETVAMSENEPAWSPNGASIAFDCFTDICTMNSDGSGTPTNLTQNIAGGGFAPSWSPDDARIAFARQLDNGVNIWVMNANGSDQTPLTSSGGIRPRWSPDGTKIAYTSIRDGDFEVYTMSANGSDQKPLTSLGSNFAMDWGVASADDIEPQLSLPADILTEATSSSGVVVTFEVTATDDRDPNPVVSCDPASGSTFPIGTTTVTCTATDEAGNTASGSFDVIVQGATEQVTNLNNDIANLNLPAGTKSSLSATLQQAQSSIEADNISAALGQLDAFISQVKAQEQRGKLSSEQAAELISSAEQIKEVLSG